jgi:hypothetical protein
MSIWTSQCQFCYSFTTYENDKIDIAMPPAAGPGSNHVVIKVLFK